MRKWHFTCIALIIYRPCSVCQPIALVCRLDVIIVQSRMNPSLSRCTFMHVTISMVEVLKRVLIHNVWGYIFNGTHISSPQQYLYLYPMWIETGFTALRVIYERILTTQPHSASLQVRMVSLYVVKLPYFIE